MTTYVVAGSYHEYFDFLEKRRFPRTTRDYTFFSDPTHLIFLKDATILCVGRYFRRSPVFSYENARYYTTINKVRFVDERGRDV
jgi:hypothetical protein